MSRLDYFAVVMLVGIRQSGKSRHAGAVLLADEPRVVMWDPQHEYEQYGFVPMSLDAFLADIDLLDRGFKSDLSLNDPDHPWSKIRANQYDLVLNGVEIASGGIRIVECR